MAESQFMALKSLILKDSIDLTNREINLYGPIRFKTFARFDRHLKLLEIAGKDPVTVVINTSGGDVYSMFAIMDRIQSSECIVNTVGIGIIASAGVAIIAAGTGTRLAYANTSFMHHASGFATDFNRLANQAVELAHNKDLDDRVCSFLGKTTKKSSNFWSTTGKHVDHWFDTDKAIEYGIIDGTI